jgi:hypothetical protein
MAINSREDKNGTWVELWKNIKLLAINEGSISVIKKIKRKETEANAIKITLII